MKVTPPSVAGPSGDQSPPRSPRSPSAPAAKRQRVLPGALQGLARAPQPHAAPTAAFSPPLQAKFGLEIEIPSVDVTPVAGGAALRRGSVLLERPHWKLECDTKGGGKHDLEFVTNPLASEHDVRAVLREITTLTAALRRAALAGAGPVRLRAVAPDAAVDAVLQVNDPHMPGRMQTTYGVGLDHLATLIDELLPAKQAEGIHRSTQAVADLYAARTGAPLPPKARAFVELINMYLTRAQSKLPADGTVHIYFRAMARSDFCAAFAKLLPPVDQAAVRTLLVAPQGMPPLMEALRLGDPAQRVFAKPYFVPDRGANDREAGPTVRAWLASIVAGRQEGPFHKDLLSPPPGYPLHGGDLSADYGMGAMGVDERNGLMLFEIRGAPYRPQHVTMNGQLARAAGNELARAARHNPTLESTRRGPIPSAKFEALRQADEAYVSLGNAAATLVARAGSLDARTWKFVGGHFGSELGKLAAARTAIAARDQSSWAPHLGQAMDALHDAADAVLRAGNESRFHELPAQLAPFKATLAHYEDALWQAGAKRK